MLEPLLEEILISHSPKSAAPVTLNILNSTEDNKEETTNTPLNTTLDKVPSFILSSFL